MGTVTLPNTLTNGEVADATEVMANLNALLTEINGLLDAANLENDAVTTVKILNAAVTAAKLASDSVLTAKIKNGNVTAVKLAADSVNGSKIADESINSEHYVDGSIDREHLAADVIDGTKIEDDAVDSEHLVAGSIDSEHLADDCVEAGKIAASGVDVDALGDVASYENAQTRKYSPTLTGYVTNRTDVVPTGSSVELKNNTDDALYVECNLPDGAIVTNLYSYCSSHVFGVGAVKLQRSAHNTAVVTDMAATTHANTGASEDGSISNATIDNDAYTYILKVYGSSCTATISCVEVTYTVTKPLP